jgi:hypothetical protein
MKASSNLIVAAMCSGMATISAIAAITWRDALSPVFAGLLVTVAVFNFGVFLRNLHEKKPPA